MKSDNLTRKLSVDSLKEKGNGNELRRSLGAFELMMLGVGVIIGSGLFVITGVAAAEQAGPAYLQVWRAHVRRCAMENLLLQYLLPEVHILLYMSASEKYSDGLSAGA